MATRRADDHNKKAMRATVIWLHLINIIAAAGYKVFILVNKSWLTYISRVSLSGVLSGGSLLVSVSIDDDDHSP